MGVNPKMKRERRHSEIKPIISPPRNTVTHMTNEPILSPLPRLTLSRSLKKEKLSEFSEVKKNVLSLSQLRGQPPDIVRLETRHLLSHDHAKEGFAYATRSAAMRVCVGA